MMLQRFSSTVVLMFFLLAGAASAECKLDAGSVRILSDDFPALRAVVESSVECATNDVVVTHNVTSEHKQLMVPALTPASSEFSVVTVANGSLMPLLNDGLVQPLDSFIDDYGKDLLPEQRITVDGQTVAIAFMVNTQHLFYRADILEQVSRPVPTTWTEVLEIAALIRDQGLMQYPLSGTFQSGWHLAQEFINLYLGHGGQFFDQDSAQPSVQSPAGIQTLALMKSLVDYMPPEFLTFDVTDVQTQWEAGEVAMMNMWGSRAGPVLDDQGASPDIVDTTRFAAAPGIHGKSTSASTLWWVGYSLAAHISKTDAIASFRTMLHATSTQTANSNNTLAAWLVRDAIAAKETTGVVATRESNAPPYPMQPWMTLMHSALGQELVEFLQGRESAAQALDDVESAYIAAARESGYLATE